MRDMALAAYRNVLRSASLAFRGTLQLSWKVDMCEAEEVQGDARMLAGAKAQARQSFEQGRSLPQDSDEYKKNLEHAEDVARILRENVVQGEAGEGKDQYSMLFVHGCTMGLD